MSKNMPDADEIDRAHWKGCAPGLDKEEPEYITQKNSGQPNDPAIGPCNKLQDQK